MKQVWRLWSLKPRDGPLCLWRDVFLLLLLVQCARTPDVGAFPRPPAGGIIMSMGFSADGLLVAAGDNKGTAHVWAKQPSGYVGASRAGRQPGQLCCRRHVCCWRSELC